MRNFQNKNSEVRSPLCRLYATGACGFCGAATCFVFRLAALGEVEHVKQGEPRIRSNCQDLDVQWTSDKELRRETWFEREVMNELVDSEGWKAFSFEINMFCICEVSFLV